MRSRKPFVIFWPQYFDAKRSRSKGRRVPRKFALEKINNNDILIVIEAKNRDSNISQNLKYFCQRYNFKGIQIVKELKREKEIESITVRKAYSYLKELIL